MQHSHVRLTEPLPASGLRAWLIRPREGSASGPPSVVGADGVRGPLGAPRVWGSLSFLFGPTFSRLGFDHLYQFIFTVTESLLRLRCAGALQGRLIWKLPMPFLLKMHFRPLQNLCCDGHCDGIVRLRCHSVNMVLLAAGHISRGRVEAFLLI